MQTIKITDFLGYDQEHIYEYLLLQETHSFCLQLDRDDEISYDAESIAREFFHAINLGEQIWAICSSFSYLVPAPYSTIPFEFEFKTNKLRALAATIFEMVKAIEGPPALAKPYWDKLFAFVDKYNNDDIDPVCIGLDFVFNEIGCNVNSNNSNGSIRF